MNYSIRIIFIKLLIVFFVPDFVCAAITNILDESEVKQIRVDSIAITGNNVTHEHIILRELNFQPGDNVTEDILIYNRERIFSLSLFTSVKIYPDSSNNNIIRIDVEESWYIWPIPFAYRNENSFKKLSYGMNLLYKNFRGRNESLSASVSLGYNPSYSLNYYNPYIDREKDISFSAGTGHVTSSNISYLAEYVYGMSFKYKIYSGWLGFGKRINVYNDAFLSLSYDYIEAPDSASGNITASGERIDRVYKAGISYNFDTRNLKQFPDSGILASISYYYKGFGINNINYSVLGLDFRHYFKVIGGLTAKWRVASRMVLGSTKRIPYYDLSFLGHGGGVRGHSTHDREGHSLYIGSFELKYPIIKELDISVKLPIVPKELTSYRVALYPNIFFDTGTVLLKKSEINLDNKVYRLSGDKFSLKSFDFGYGAGLILLILPYNIFRFEIAFDEKTNTEYNLGFGFSF